MATTYMGGRSPLSRCRTNFKTTRNSILIIARQIQAVEPRRCSPGCVMKAYKSRMPTMPTVHQITNRATLMLHEVDVEVGLREKWMGAQGRPRASISL